MYVLYVSMCVWEGGPMDVYINLYLCVCVYAHICIHKLLHTYFQGHWVDLMCVRMYLSPYIDVFLMEPQNAKIKDLEYLV